MATSRASMTLTSTSERRRFLRANSNISALETHLGRGPFFRFRDLPVRLLGEIEESGRKQRRKALGGVVVCHDAVVVELPGERDPVFRGCEFFEQGEEVLV